MRRKAISTRVVNLKSLIAFLAFLVAFFTLINGFYASYQVQKNQLIQHTLDTNHAYAQKLALAAENFIQSAHTQLGYAADVVAQNFNDEALLLAEVERLYEQTASFNSVTVVDAQGIILATAPSTLEVVGAQLTEGGGPEALRVQTPWVSRPFLSVAGNLIVLISAPVFAETGEYLGYVGGAIYLEEPSILHSLLDRHFHIDGSYIYVVDNHKQIIFHPEPERIGAYILDNQAINSVVENESGSKEVVNSKGIDMLAGYAPVAATQWGVVAQRPVEATLSPLDNLMKGVVMRTVPLALVTFALIWFLAVFISRPLRLLADIAGNIDDPQAHKSLDQVKAWYLEAREMKQAMLKGLGVVNTRISQLKKDAITDPLTGAVNRRSLQQLLDTLEQDHVPFSVLAMDIDHFKRVNDTYGHPVGDKVLVELVRVVSEVSREHDVMVRTGGEEFVLILPHTQLELAMVIAERVRSRVASTYMDPVGYIQISIGIAVSVDGSLGEEALERADQALYRAKQQGRNRCEVA